MKLIRHSERQLRDELLRVALPWSLLSAVVLLLDGHWVWWFVVPAAVLGAWLRTRGNNTLPGK